MCCCDSDPPDVYNRVTRKARKSHRCSECCRTIAGGERYEEHSGLWDGRWETYRWCAHCAAAQKILDREIKDFCFCLSQLWEAAHEIRDDWWWEATEAGRVKVRPVRLPRLLAGANRKWTHRRGPKAGQLMPVPVVKSEPVRVAS